MGAPHEPRHPDEAKLEAALHATIPEMLRRHVDQTPDRHALVFFDHGVSVTYAELDLQVRRVAAGLRAQGVRKGTHVALMLPNAIEFPVTWLALAWIGAVSVQLNPKFTGRELDYVLNDADIDFLILDQTCLPSLADMKERSHRLPDAHIFVRTEDAEVMSFTAWSALLANDPLPCDPSDDRSAHDVMSILYTSGTTGFPKGCLLDHRYWLQIGAAGLYSQGGHTPRNALIYEPMFYIQGNAILVMSLLSNATAYCPAQPSIAKFFDWVHRYAIDYCAFPAPAVHAMEDHPSEMGQSLNWVHAWYFHGDWLKRMEDRFGVIGRDSYAMTENGLCTYVPVDRPDLVEKGSIGVVAPWRDIRIVDDEGRDAPDGEAGEAWTAGPGHFHGYYRKPGANRDSFRGRWFRTGDLVRREADGGLYLVGRIKDMIKRSGENVSAAEVEACLCELPGVVLAAVVAAPDEARGEEIKAYVKLKDGLTQNDLPPSAIFAHCAGHLAAFKVPRYLSYTSTFPMTVSDDKVAKAQLTDGVADLTADAFDRIDGVWR